MTLRLTLTLCALGVALAGCASLQAAGPTPAPATAALSPTDPVGHSLDEVMAVNGPPSQQWEMPDGRTAYQWQSSSISATVAPSRKGEIKAAGVSQTTCFYTLYARRDSKGVIKVVGADEPKPGCMKLAMAGQ